MKNLSQKGLIVLCLFFCLSSFSQTTGDYKSNGTGGGAWNAASTWLQYNGSSYAAAGTAPGNSTNNIIIQGGDAVSVTDAQTVSSLTVAAGGSLTVSPGQPLTLNGNPAVDGSFTVSGNLICGAYIIQGSGSFILNSGATLNIGSAAGIASSSATGNIQTTNRSFSTGANYTYTGTAAQVTGNGLPSGITGVITDNNSQTSSGLTLSATVTITAPGSFVVPSGSVLTCPNTINITGTGNFSLASGATIFIGSLQGISNTASTGNVQITGTKTLSAAANYTYYGTSGQSTGNALPSPYTGTLTFANTGGSGTLLTNNLILNTPGLVNVTGGLATGTNVISGTGTFTLNPNATILTANVDGLDATGTTGSIQTSTRNLNSASNYTYYASAAQVTGSGLPATVTSLYINTTSTVSLTNDITLNGALTLQNGTFCLNGKTINIPSGRAIGRNNGILQLCGGNLNYQGTVSITYTGTNAITTGLEIPASPSALADLTINGTGKVVTLGQDVTVNNSLTMTAGTLQLAGYNLVYSGASKLVYNGSAAQTAGVEWPNAAFDRNVQISNTNAASGVALNADKRNYSGTLTVTSTGYFNSGGYSVYGTGNIAVNSGGTYITSNPAGVSTSGAIQLTGTRTFASGSSYHFNGTAAQVSGAEMPTSVTNLTVNNTSGAASAVTLTVPGSTLTVTGTLALTSGILDAATNNVNIIFQTGNIPISRTSGSFTPFAAGFLQFGSAGNTGGNAFTIPGNAFTSAPLLNNLIVNRTNALTLGNQNITLNGTLTLTNGVLDIGSTTLGFQNGNTPVSVTAGSLMAGAGASLQFGAAGNTGGAAFTLPNNLFTSAPTLNNLTINRVSALTLGTQPVTVGGTLTLTNGTLNISNGTLGLNGTISIASGVLNGGTTSNLSVGGTGSSLTLPSTLTALNNLTVARPNASSVPAAILSGSLTINGGVDLNGGSLSLGASNLTLSSAATITNYNTARYIVTANTPASGGFLIRNVSTAGTLFPIGTSSYTPFTISITAGTADNFSVRVFDGLLSGGTSGSTDANSNHAVNKTWVVGKAVSGGAAATLTAQWNTADENVNFSRSASVVAQNNGTKWGSNSNATAATSVSPGVWSRSRDNTTTFTSFSVQDVLGAVLPVKWLQFTAVRQAGIVQLNWLMENSVPSQRFEIERSANGTSGFEKIGVVQGQDNGQQARYAFTDGSPATHARSFYRLKRIDATGSYEYSPIRVINDEDGNGLLLQLAPMPASDLVHASFNCSASGSATITIYDAAGHTIRQETVIATKGFNVFDIQLNRLSKGLYFIRLELGKDVCTAKLVK